MPAMIAMPRKTIVNPTLKNSARSSALYTTGDVVNATPIAIRRSSR